MTRRSGAAAPEIRGAPRPALLLIAGVLSSVALGPLIVGFPPAVVVLAGLGVFVYLVRAHQFQAVFLSSLGGLLVGYAFFGKGVAYFGLQPVYVGEVILGLAVVAVGLELARCQLTWFHLLLVAFIILGAARTAPFLTPYGLDAARDAVTWGYALFALALSVTLTETPFRRGLSAYGALVPIFVLWVPIAAFLYTVLPSSIPRQIGTDVPILVFKSGDMAVHLAGAAVFILLGLDRWRGWAVRLGQVLILPVWLISAGMVAAISRGAFLALAGGLSLSAILRLTRRWIGLVAVGLLFVVAVEFIQPEFYLGSQQRKLSLDQLAGNLSSVVSPAGESGLEGTKYFRLRWWGDIVAYTFTGAYFWTGKGFGVNLADSDGFQVTSDHSLRSPHNTHLTILARMGVPGFVVWVALQALFAVALFAAFLRARKHRTPAADWWARIDVFILAYWLAMMINTAFDPYLEGPQGGIWFWSLVGFGMAALRLQRDALGMEVPKVSLSTRPVAAPAPTGVVAGRW